MLTPREKRQLRQFSPVPVSKFCRSCARDLPLTAFNKNRHRPDNLASWCRTCMHAAVATSKAKRIARETA